jgi:hypothetical protein
VCVCVCAVALHNSCMEIASFNIASLCMLYDTPFDTALFYMALARNENAVRMFCKCILFFFWMLLQMEFVFSKVVSVQICCCIRSELMSGNPKVFMFFEREV